MTGVNREKKNFCLLLFQMRLHATWLWTLNFDYPANFFLKSCYFQSHCFKNNMAQFFLKHFFPFFVYFVWCVIARTFDFFLVWKNTCTWFNSIFMCQNQLNVSFQLFHFSLQNIFRMFWFIILATHNIFYKNTDCIPLFVFSSSKTASTIIHYLQTNRMLKVSQNKKGVVTYLIYFDICQIVKKRIFVCLQNDPFPSIIVRTEIRSMSVLVILECTLSE
jgi:hypothetical protein